MRFQNSERTFLITGNLDEVFNRTYYESTKKLRKSLNMSIYVCSVKMVENGPILF